MKLVSYIPSFTELSKTCTTNNSSSHKLYILVKYRHLVNTEHEHALLTL